MLDEVANRLTPGGRLTCDPAAPMNRDMM